MLGNQFVLIGGNGRIGAVLWILGIVLWLARTSVVFTLLITKSEKPTLAMAREARTPATGSRTA